MLSYYNYDYINQCNPKLGAIVIVLMRVQIKAVDILSRREIIIECDLNSLHFDIDYHWLL